MTQVAEKVEIRIIDGEWQWIGKLTKSQIKVLCTLADALCDLEEQ